MENDYSKRVLEVLEKSEQPMDIEKIRLEADIGHWNTALRHCLELLLAGKIRGQKTTKSWVFWAKNAPNTHVLNDLEKNGKEVRP